MFLFFKKKLDKKDTYLLICYGISNWMKNNVVNTKFES